MIETLVLEHQASSFFNFQILRDPRHGGPSWNLQTLHVRMRDAGKGMCQSKNALNMIDMHKRMELLLKKDIFMLFKEKVET